ncbi:ABC1 family-domain-containing protein [Lentinula aciculospora]|uniref:ABC1 family-domain-containing protein n=1 Tax=Lentinula aciculospora TaxID=153920 RepID=A0A9W9AKJ4_9AGAR|nr:ABC1 family-domain-containing protein [Lentinula aciculospora]
MPPGPVYNWICVFSSAAEIVGHAARYRASQVTRLSRKSAPPNRARDLAAKNDWNNLEARTKTVQDRLEIKEIDAQRVEEEEEEIVEFLEVDTVPTSSPAATAVETTRDPFGSAEDRVAALKDAHNSSKITSNVDLKGIPTPVLNPSSDNDGLSETRTTTVDPAHLILAEPEKEQRNPTPATAPLNHKNTLQSSKVPSSKLGRLFHYGGLAASLGYGAASEFLRPSTSSANASDASNRSVMLSNANISRLVSKLSQMRGAALKLGQFLSIQDTHLLPPEVDAVFRRVQDSAHYMPDWQMEQVLSSALGSSWSTEYFEQFNRIPFAAASIGQVHEGVLKAEWSPTGQPAKVAVKVQFPNIRDSISADLSYITWLLRVTLGGKILPRGLFLDRTMEVMKSELADECNYVREAHFLRQFRSADFLGRDPRFHVPWVSSISSEHVLVMEFVEGGVSLGSELVTTLPQKEKDNIATTILQLCLLELFRFGTMQTDPNYSNFLYVPESGKIALIDFGATREYEPEFLDGWRRLLEAAASLDLNSNEVHQSSAWNACIDESISLGYLVGGPGESESPEMVEAHVTSLALLAYPFNERTPQPVRFGKGSEFGRNTERIRNELIPVMLRERKKGPPRETYSLNRKLSGAFLLASRLGATIHASHMWEDVLRK